MSGLGDPAGNEGLTPALIELLAGYGVEIGRVHRNQQMLVEAERPICNATNPSRLSTTEHLLLAWGILSVSLPCAKRNLRAKPNSQSSDAGEIIPPSPLLEQLSNAP